MQFEQFKELDADGKLNVLYSLITNHLRHHEKWIYILATGVIGWGKILQVVWYVAQIIWGIFKKTKKEVK